MKPKAIIVCLPVALLASSLARASHADSRDEPVSPTGIDVRPPSGATVTLEENRLCLLDLSAEDASRGRWQATLRFGQPPQATRRPEVVIAFDPPPSDDREYPDLPNQYITDADTMPPMIACPPDVTIECDQPADPTTTGQATALDDRDPNPVITYLDNGSTALHSKGFLIARTWTATDASGNPASCTQLITVIDTTPPQITCPQDVIVQCDEPIEPWGLSELPDSPNRVGQATAIGNCDPHPAITYSDEMAAGLCPQGSVITRTWTATDASGNSVSRTQIIAVVDTTAPQITCPPNVIVECDQSTDREDIGGPTVVDNCDPDPEITYWDDVAPGPGPQESVITRAWTATDACGNPVSCRQIITVVDTTAPQITCPPDVTVLCDESLDPADTGQATAVDNCDPSPSITYSDLLDEGPGPSQAVVTRTWTATDGSGNSVFCAQVITVNRPSVPALALAGSNLAGAGKEAATIRYDIPEPPPERAGDSVPASRKIRLGKVLERSRSGEPLPSRGAEGRVSAGEKGSLLIFPKVEVRWDAAGSLLQDTFVTINNDYNAEVSVQLYFVSEGHTVVDNISVLTQNEPAYWSAATGLPKGVSPWAALGEPYPDPDLSDDFVMRGHLLAWAVNAAQEEIRWNHLFGAATIMSYHHGNACEYNACAFQALYTDDGHGESPAHGEQTGDPGILNLDGNEFECGYNKLLFGFVASGSTLFSDPGFPLTHDTDLTLLILDNDLRQDADPPFRTKAKFHIWNENEVGFSGLAYCITRWNESLLSRRGSHFLAENLQTSLGHARIDGQRSTACSGSTDRSLLGVAVRMMQFDN